MSDLAITSIFIYPIKSLGGIELQSARVEARGFEYDRRWMLVDENNQFLTQRRFPEMALLQPKIGNGFLSIEDRSGKMEMLNFPLEEPDTNPETVTVWDDECLAKPLSPTVDQWFTKVLGKHCRLVYMHEASIRQADQRYAIQETDKVSFADAYPLLMLGEASLQLLNSKLEQPVSINRFRPNIVFKGGDPHEEDTFRKIVIDGVEMFGVKPCARCVMTTIDPITSEKGKEPLKTLSSYRKTGEKILFGENFIPVNGGELKVGLPIEVVERKNAPI